MNYSIFYHHVCRAAEERGCSVPQMLGEMNQLGVGYVELDRDAVGQSDGEIRAFRQMLDTAGLRPSSIYGFFSWNDGSLPSEDDLLLRQAALLGCPRVMVIPGFYSAPADEDACRAEKARMIEGTRRFVDLARRQGVTVTIECFDDARSPIATIRGMAEFLQAVPELYVTLETGNFLFSGDDILEAHRAFRPRVRHVHLKDRYRPACVPGGAPREMLAGDPVTAVTGETLYPCAVGQGHIPMAQVLADLARDGYDGVLAIEHFGVARYDDAIRASAAWLKEQEACL